MTALRQRMIAAMQMHGFSARTHQSYLAAVRDLAKFTHRAPDALAPGDVQGYFEHLVRERGLAPASVRLFYHGIRFFYLQVLNWPAVDLAVTLPKRPQRIPELLTREEVAAILGACADVRHHMMLSLCYGCGLRHAYATHQLAAGLPVQRLQRLLGHQSIHTTLRYVHWLPSAREGEGMLDVLAQLEAAHG